ncbi:MAG: hypothetical protein ACOX61_10665 [Brooklawnia sp.]|jgi:hypothetical protein
MTRIEPQPRPPQEPQGPANKRGMGKWIVVGAVAALVVVLAALAFVTGRIGGQQGSDPDGPQAPTSAEVAVGELEIGQCLQFAEVSGAAPTDGSIEVAHQVVDCNLVGQFKLKVASIHQGSAECPTDYVRYFEQNLLGNAEEATVCLSPVLDTGACYKYDRVQEWLEVDCRDPEAEFIVEKELPDTTDTAECTFTDGAFVLPEPAPGRVYCIAAPA